MIQLVPAETFIGHNSTFLYLGVFFWLNANVFSRTFHKFVIPISTTIKVFFFFFKESLKPIKYFFSSQLKLK